MNYTEQEHRKALRRFHALCRELGITPEEKRAIVESQGVASSTDIPWFCLKNICNNLQRGRDPKASQMDALRKRVMASIGGWLKAAGYKSNGEIIKAVACRASGYDNFNKIPAARLHNLYFNFRNKQIDKQAAEVLKGLLLSHQVDVVPEKKLHS